MVALLGMVLLSIASRQLHFHVPGTDAYAGYLMAGAGFLALAHTLKRASISASRCCSTPCAAAGARRWNCGPWPRPPLLALLFAFTARAAGVAVACFPRHLHGQRRYAAVDSQLAMALGTAVLAIAFLDELVLELRGRRTQPNRERPCAMSDLAITGLLVLSLFLILGSGGGSGSRLRRGLDRHAAFSSRPAGDAMAVTIWGRRRAGRSPPCPVHLDGRNPVPHPALARHVQGPGTLGARTARAPAAHQCGGCTIFAAVSGSSAATCATIGKMTLPELTWRGYPEHMVIGTWPGPAPWPAHPAVHHHDRLWRDGRCLHLPAFCGGCCPACCWRAVLGYIMLWALRNPGAIPEATERLTLRQNWPPARALIPVVLLIAAVLGSIYTGIATATEAAAVGVVGALVLSALQGSLHWASFVMPPWAPHGCTA